MRPWLFTVGDTGIPSYWAMLMIGFCAAFYMAWREARHDGLDPNRMLDLSLLMLLAGIVGARLMHVMVEDDPLNPGRSIFFYYLQHPLDIFKLWNGLAFYGGFLLALPLGLWFAKAKGLGVAKVADIAAVSIPLGLVFGRLGCLMAGCCHGKPTDLPWGITFTDPMSLARPLGIALHPTQLYSSAYALVLFFALLIQKRRWQKFPGQVFLSFCLLYSAGRFLIEFVRNDNRGLWFGGSLSSSQVIALAMVLGSLLALVWLGRKNRETKSTSD